jgi:TetR/AcrR family transcriptional regulator, acrAB operon repressor
MARKTKEDTEATREGILNAAELCFLREGVFRTTLEQIANRAGYTRGAVYWHFKNKLEVLEAVMERVELPIFSGLDEMASAANEQPLNAVRRFYKRAFDEFARNPHARNAIEIVFLKCELVEETKPIFARKQRGGALALSRLTQTLKHAHRLKQLREGLNPETCAMAIHFAIVGALREWMLNPDSVSLQRDGTAALEILLSSFAAEAPARHPRKATVAQRSAAQR